MLQNRVLRVLAIDDDSVSLKILARNLEQCGYKAISLTKATEALALLRENRDDFDVVLTDIMMPDMDGFQLLETICSEIDVPVIMVSTETDPKKIVKGIKSGAQDYFVKPVQIEDLKKLPEYVTKRLGSSERSHEDELSEKYETESDQSDTPKRKHKKLRKRVNWTPELHDKFMNAVEQLEADDRSKVIPTKILEIMQEPSLNRENVASHLQKFRKGIMKRRSSESSSVAAAAIPASTADHSRAMTSTNVGLFHNFSGSGMMNSLNQIFPKSGSFYPANQNPLLFSPSNTIPQNCFPYPQMHPENISTPMLGNICSPMLGNVCSPMLGNASTSTPMLGNASTPMLESVLSAPTQNPERKGLRLPNTWQTPCDPEFAPYTQSPPAFNASNQMQQSGVPTQMIMTSQVGSQLQQTHCPFSGQHDMQYKCSTVKADPNLTVQNRQISDFCYKEQTKLNEPIGEYPNRLEHQDSLDVFVDIASQYFSHQLPDCFDDNEMRLIN